MPTARQWEKIADRVCRAAGAVHSPAAGGAANAICPVGVRLARRLLATRSIREAVRTTVPGKRVLINQIRTFAREQGLEAALPIIKALAPTPAGPAPGVPVAPASRQGGDAKSTQGMVGHIVHSMPTFFNAIDRFGELLKDPQNPRRKRRPGGSDDFFQPGEEGF